jgi:hypothetical protein
VPERSEEFCDSSVGADEPEEEEKNEERKFDYHG